MKFSLIPPNTWGIDSWKPTGEILAVKIFEVVLELEHTSQPDEDTPINTPLPQHYSLHAQEIEEWKYHKARFI